MTTDSPAAPTPAIRATVVVQPGQGRVVQAFGDTVQFMLEGTHTAGAMAVALNTVPPRQGPPPHIHHSEDELFLVIEGTFEFMHADGQWSAPVGPGGLAYTPRGLRHSFRNAGDTPARSWIIVTPCGFEKFFTECETVFAAAAQAGGPPDMARIVEISTAHGIEYVPPLGDRPPAAAGQPPVAI